MTFNIYTLGCKVNSYESNVMIDKLINAGYKQVDIDENSDISIINTCTVTNNADSKSRKMINSLRKKNPQGIIVACGCFVQNKGQEKIDDVDILIGNTGKSQIVKYIETFIDKKQALIDIKPFDKTSFEEMVLNNFNKTRAFVKIQDGCNNFCSFCVIPYVRGNVRSKRREDVLKEVNNLVKNGHKEIVLTGIHTGNYGCEFKDYKLADLLKDLIKTDGLERIRISSIEMNEITEDVLDIIKKSKIIVDHMHIPLQSGSDSVLKRMNRKYNTKEFLEKIKTLRKIRPDISITTDVIVGFPAESEDEFNETVAFIKKVKFSKIHVFPYSKRDKTKAALMDNQVDSQTKKERVKILLALSKDLEQEYMKRFIEKEVFFIPEVYKEGYIIGHTGNYLTIKMKGAKADLYKLKKTKVKELKYPYCIGYN